VRWIHAELLKLLTLPALRLTAALTLATTAFLAWLDTDPIIYTQVGFLVLGALTATESQRMTLLAMPHRIRLHAAKLIALTAVAIPLAALAAVPASKSAAVYLVLTTLLAFGAGTLIRHPLAAVLTLLATHVIAGPMVRAAYESASAFLPDTPAWHLTQGFLATVIWTAATLVLSAYAFHRRDAT
jgi:ABC-2 type transport system permease protein